MPDTDGQNADTTQPEAPQRLSDDLADLYGTPFPVPPQLDRAIAAGARARFARARRSRMVLRLVEVTAAAAALLLVLWLVEFGPQPTQPVASPGRTPVRHDLDGNGRVNILDAFVLARYIESASTPRPDWDVNGDGRIDRTDVDTVALAAVTLNGRSYQ